MSPSVRTRSHRSGLAAGLGIALFLATVARAGADDSGWPRQFESSSGTFVVYEPQPEDLQGDELTGRAAFSIERPGAAAPVFGVLWLTERVQIDRDSSTVRARDLDVTKVRLPQITPDEARRYEHLVEAEALRWDLSGSVEQLRAGLAAAEKERANVEDLDHAPPRIRFLQQRTLLVVYDGDPALEPIDNSNLEYVANTPYAIVFDPDAHTYYLTGANLWYAARDPLGPWDVVERVPAEVRRVVPPDTSAADVVAGEPPRVLTATEPTEIIVTDGPPRWAPLVGGELLYVANTESDVLRDVNTQEIYLLLSGRWYAAPGEQGPWTWVRPDRLPATFRQIPPDSPKGNVLASVAGTDAADDAVADAEIPQTTAVRRDARDFAVRYDGTPQFDAIPGTSDQYAVNTDAEVIEADGRFYACDQGVWYIADDPNGPWSVSETRPLDIDAIPPSCPVYDTRYVFIYSATPDVVYEGYLPGYFGCFPAYGVVVYGTGYHYRPWRSRRHFYPRPWTWGFHARYNPWLARWSFGTTFGAGFLRVGTRWRPDAVDGPRAHHERWFGPGGFRRPLVGRDLAPLRGWQGRRRLPDALPANLYSRPENARRIARAALREPLHPLAQPLAPTPRPNDVFAGKDGRVYQRDPAGRWRVNDGRAWRPTPAPTTPATPVVPAPSPFGGDTRARRGPSGTFPRSRPVEPPSSGGGRGGRAPAPAMPARPAVRPAPFAPTPGDLEGAFRARQRSGQTVAPGFVPPTPAPQPRQQAAPAPAPSAPPRDREPNRPEPRRDRPNGDRERENHDRR